MPGAKARTLDVRDSLKRKIFGLLMPICHIRSSAGAGHSSSELSNTLHLHCYLLLSKCFLYMSIKRTAYHRRQHYEPRHQQTLHLASLHPHGLTCHVFAVGSSKEAHDLADILRKPFSAAQNLMPNDSQLGQRFCLDPNE